MKILIIANSTLVFGKELKEVLEKEMDVMLLDFEHLYLFGHEERDDRLSRRFSMLKRLPKLSMLFRIYLIGKEIKEGKYDVVNIHYNRWYYRWLLPLLNRTGTKLVVSTYGSDFYRASDRIRNRLRPIYEQADAVTFTNILTKEAFVNFYGDFGYKSYVCRFGLKTLDYIDRNRDANRREIRRKLGYATDKIIVTCGYNATSAQQHFQIIEAIEGIERDLKKRCQFIFPLTYGDEGYKRKVTAALEKVSFDYVVLEDFLYADDNAYVKLASDVMVNMLETDSFSGSMQEFLYADNVVITGKWLPYGTFDDAGIFWHKIESTQELGSTMQNVLSSLENSKQKTGDNRTIIASLSSWKRNAESWKNVFKGVMV